MNAHDPSLSAPNNIGIEQALLGAVLVNNDAYFAVSDFLRAGHFYEPLHRRMFDVVAELIKMGKVANPVTVKTYLPSDERIGAMSVAEYLARLAAEAVNIVNAPDYAREIVALAQFRSLIVVGDDLVRECYDLAAEATPRELSDRFIERISEATGLDTETIGSTGLGDAIDRAISMASASGQGKRGGGFRYRFDPLHRLIGPLSPGQLIILGGATKQGKTALVGQIAIGAALEGTPAWVYSGEMTAEELAMREIGRNLKIPVWKQKRGAVTEAEFEAMHAFRSQMRSVPLMIQERRLTLNQLKERCRRIVRKKGPMVLVVDHIGLLDRDKSNAKLSEWEFGQEVTRELKTLARELCCPVIACAQLKKNTFAENKGPLNERFLAQIVQRKPRYADLIGAVERDADHVIIPFRPEVFLAEHEPAEGSDLFPKWEDMMSEWRGKAQIVLALSRETQWPRHVNVGWDGSTTSFFEIGSGQEELVAVAAEYVSNPMRLC